MIQLGACKKFSAVISLILMTVLAAVLTPGLVLANAEAWNIQTIDPDEVHSTSIVMDSHNRPHISYHDYTSGALKYARFNGTTWDIQAVDPVGNYGGGTSIALDNNDSPHISYYDEPNVRLKYAYWTGSAWHIEAVSPQWSNGRDSSLALDSNGYPHISWSGGGVYHLMYTKWTGSTWETTDIESDARHKSLVLDSNGHPHISYYVALPYNYLKYATYNGISWNTEVVDTSDVPDGSVGSANSMALDSNNRPHIAYSDDSNKTIKYAKWTGTEWVKETVDSSTISYNSVALALDSSNTPHISYTTDSSGSLHYARLTGSAWVKETVDPNDFRDTSIILDSKGCPCISYATSGSEGGLNYAYGCSKFPWPMFLPAMKKNSQP
ncbi:MAG: hypothetical protein KKE53_15690 [Proteobacteria bacterium]|nr:hypothetical protein [Pseudomonadota bacterium]